jgi:hypothetical protein
MTVCIEEHTHSVLVGRNLSDQHHTLLISVRYQ